MGAVPEVNRRILEALLEARLPGAKDRRLVLVHGRYDRSSPSEFTVRISGKSRRVAVTDQPSVLGIVDAWRAHRSATSDTDDVLVVTTSVEDAQLGWDLRGHALGRATCTVDRVEIVKQRFGAVDVDPRIRRERWLVDALLDAEPASGWRRSGQVLTRDAAVRALIGARLGSGDLAEGTLDASSLLTWSRSVAGSAFASLPRSEQAGLTSWLTEKVGGAAVVLMSLASEGRAQDAMALGVLASAITAPDASTQTALEIGRLLGQVRPRGNELTAFVDAVEGTLDRWAIEAASGAAHAAMARQQVLDVIRQADDLAVSADLTDALVGNRFLTSSFSARLRVLTAALARGRLEAAEAALGGVEEHALARLFPERATAAATAVRLARWLAEPEEVVDSVASGVRAHLADWGWVDRALALLWAGDSVHDPVVGQAYRSLYDAVRARRDRLDEQFAKHLTVWTQSASTHAPGGCLLIEDVLERVALPLSGAAHAPLVIVLDGMSSAVATEFGEQLAGRGWSEASPRVGERTSAVSAVPSVTRVSRACLLTGGLSSGDQATERNGFESFWRKHRKNALLLHKGDIAGHAGQRLAEPLIASLAGDDVVAVVLNTIDDALDHGREGDRTGWRLTDITYLAELLDAARAYARPVVLVSDHGHVLDRTPAGSGPVPASGVQSARWRTGTPEAGEIALTGPRVLDGAGSVVVPWREDIHYTPRKAGYHGGAALAEMTVPVLVFLPSADLLPSGWHLLSPEMVTPTWWRSTTVRVKPVPGRKNQKPESRKEAKAAEQSAPLFTVEEALPATPTLGASVVASKIYDAQKAFVPKAPKKPEVAAVIDKLSAAGGRCSLAEAATAAGRAGRNPEFLVSILQRLLNVEGYPVLSSVDGGRTLELNLQLLREQFNVEKP
ncbi:PglZ domain-containing protein [Lentzea fradiae]|uniref:PglZ domain-containing protein n=1 Tax=Lentzea fradiae TaxID=200378 RepID=A0A1G7R0I3_9PSEU|nr:BREX-2 system phosphatase PglZ [Lentzea fradiae]SDG04194.1 PglZ domain-containing protein [Lentzea fradiae]